MTIKEIKTGQDSFLDITANLVGILIILVVVVGAQAKQNWVKNQAASEETARVEELREKIENAELTVDKLTRDNHLLEQQADKEAAFAKAVAERRQQMLVQIEMVKQKIDEKKSLLKDDEKIRFDSNVRKASLESELEKLKREAVALKSNQVQNVETIDHYPTPIARTVLSDEVHFRLYNGKLMYVPMDELTKAMKAEWRTKAEKLRQAPTTVETVGPIGEFRMQYQLEAVEIERLGESGRVTNQIIRLKRFVMIPVFEDGGETVAQALGNDSKFRKIITPEGKKRPTVSIWVYPNSFTQYNQVKEWLRVNGFQAACWPLAEGRLISGSPNGLKSSAQ